MLLLFLSTSSSSLLSLIRDYVDLLSSNSLSSWDICLTTIIYFFKSFIGVFQYVLTFGWLKDGIYAPLTVPDLKSYILSGEFFENSITFLKTTPKSDSFWSLLIIGFGNSFFSCLPFSASHLLSIRRVFIQGDWAGLASINGMMIGECLFLGLTLSGYRLMQAPFMSSEIFSYLGGLILIFSIISEMANEKRIRPILQSETSTLNKICFLSFLLSWTEQSGFCNFLRTITVTSNPTILSESFSSDADCVAYFVGIVLGSLLFNRLFFGATLILKRALQLLFKVPSSIWLKKINFVLLTLTLGFSLSSVSFYSLDYLLGAGLGFTSQDKVFSNSLFAQEEMEDPNRLLASLDGAYPLTIDTDISYYDRGNFVSEQPGFFKKTFEELNYQSEYAWTSRRDKKPNLYNSAQTTKTKILAFFQGQRDQPSDSALVQDEGPRQIGVKLSDSFKKSTGKDRQKVKKRFETNYGDIRESENFVLGDSFNTFPLSTDREFSPLEKSIKTKYAENPIYRVLLGSEIDQYLQRSAHGVFVDEAEIFEKMKLLRQYYDTKRLYEKMPYEKEFQEFFQGSKSYVDRAYHHQFKGNLNVVSKYFGLSWNDNAWLREPLLPVVKSLGQEGVLSYDEPLYLDVPFQQHEELDMFEMESPFLELSDSMPFYLGYDDQLEQQVLTTVFGSDSPVSRGPSPFWEFWPLDKSKLKLVEIKGSSSFVTLFHSSLNPDMKAILSTLSITKKADDVDVQIDNYRLPPNMKYLGTVFPAHLKFFGKSASERLIPNYGGWSWPGHDFVIRGNTANLNVDELVAGKDKNEADPENIEN